MGRKTHTKKLRTREAFIAARTLGSVSIFQTTTGNIALNPMKHYCLQKAYKNPEFQEIMGQSIRKMRENFEKARNSKENS